jgi:homoaconitase/3-isopropylmalate dehydratase large subunit
VPDDVTSDYISRRCRKTNCINSLYFKPDPEAGYAGTYTIDLSKVEASVAVYPNPDDVVSVSEKAGMHLDGVFIGACTTTEEELVLAALVLKVGLQKKLPIAKGKKHYVPGSLPVVEKLRELGLLEVYEEAGFTKGPPGCSYCVGMSAEKAAEGETWLSSQNRNFKNRMGKGEPRTSDTAKQLFRSQWLISALRLFRKCNLHHCLCSFQFQHVRDGSRAVSKGHGRGVLPEV